MVAKQYRRVLTIAGSDSGGGAGIQADIKTISACRCYASSAITCVTAQNTLGVQAIEPLSVGIIGAQIDSVLGDIGADAIKIGMLGSPEIARAVAEKLRNVDVPIVLDPVLVATSGDVLTKNETIEVIVNELIPLAAVVTPNLDEAKVLTGYDDARAWDFLREKGAKALLLKGGHGTSDELSDTLFTPEKIYKYINRRIYTKNTHGTGCSLSSAIASYLARGEDINKAVEFAVEYVQGAIAAGADYELGDGHGAINHFYRFW